MNTKLRTLTKPSFYDKFVNFMLMLLLCQVCSIIKIAQICDEKCHKKHQFYSIKYRKSAFL